jgi:hypothetical protein
MFAGIFCRRVPLDGVEPRQACENGDAGVLRSCLQANPGLDLSALEDEGEMPSPLLNLAAETGPPSFSPTLTVVNLR